MLFSGLTYAQTTVFEDNFDSYTVGQTITTQSTDWQTWSGATGESDDAFISSDQANSASNSMRISNDNDIVYSFNDKNTGVYDVSFNIYIQSGNGACFNIQHEFKENWAFNLYFYDNDSITFSNGKVDKNLMKYNRDQWYDFDFNIDLNNDTIIISVDDVVLDGFKFSESSSYRPLITLNCINFFGMNGKPKLSNSDFFIDDFKFTEVVGANELNIDVTEINSNGDAQTLTIDNNGEAPLSFRAYPVYDEHASFSNQNIINDTLFPGDATFETPILEIDGWEAGEQVEFATRYYPEKIQNLVGLKIDSIKTLIYGGIENSTATINIRNRGEFIRTFELGDVIYNQEFTNVPDFSFYNFALNQSFRITGEEFTIGYDVNGRHKDSIIITVYDHYESTAEEHVNYHGSNDDGFYEANMNIVLLAFISGELWPQWLSLSTQEGIIDGSGSQNIDLTFNKDILEVGIYTAKVVFACNDDNAEFTDIPVTLDLVNDINGIDKIGVMSYPNPTNDYLFIKSDDKISNLQMYSVDGKLLIDKKLDSNFIKVDVQELPEGSYITKINVKGNWITKTVIVNK